MFIFDKHIAVPGRDFTSAEIVRDLSRDDERARGGRRTFCPPFEIARTKEYEERKKRLIRA